MTPPLSLTSTVGELKGVGPASQAALEQLGIVSVQDLLEYLPFRLEDRSKLVEINQLRFDEFSVIRGQVGAVSSRKSQKGTLIIQAKITDETGSIPALWFNQRYILRFLKKDDQVLLYGAKKVAPKLGNPFFVKAIIAKPEVLPIYHSSAGLTQNQLRRLFRQIKPIISQMRSLLPNQPDKTKQILLERCHFDSSETSLGQLRRWLAEEELLLLALKILANQQIQKRQETLVVDVKPLKTVVDNLPFKLTDGQRQTAWEIIQDLASETVMRRILYGEVGSGKTIIAFLAAAAAIQAGQQVAFLAPTTTLAIQQAESAKKFFEPLGYKVALVIGSLKEDSDHVDLIVGTQAVLGRKEQLDRLGLVIIDEQHRFGVRDRQELLQNRPEVALLMMTATPIPRSLAQTIFGHLAISYLRGRPAHQKEVKTVIFEPKERLGVEKEIRTRLERGEPGYVICPLIQSPNEEVVETLFGQERKAISSEEKRLKKEFPNSTIGVLHGRLKNEQKEKILTNFKNGEIDILLSTTVVEVGIDNQRASWILIEEADRFGLSQLHQLRGRVGRGTAESICFLADSQTSPIGRERLEALCQTTDGLELAEKDLALRGPGEIIGFEQSGLPSLRFADWRDVELIKAAFALAKKIRNDGIAKYPALQAAMKKFEGTVTLG